jgi:hypothetical protein
MGFKQDGEQSIRVLAVAKSAPHKIFLKALSGFGCCRD